MKAINWIISIIQSSLVVLYFAFYNVQYYWSLKATVMNVIHVISKVV
jgi:hypothetical protein